MRRREFVTSLGALVLETAAVYAAAPTTLGGRLRRLTAPGTGDNRATYLPDGTALLFASRRAGRAQIWTMDPDGGDPRQLYESAANDYGRVAPSPDGRRLSFSSDRSGQNVVYVLDARRATITPISDPMAWSFGPSWSSRDRIAYFSREGGNRLNIWTVSPDGSDRQQVTNRPGESRQPWWSPDGTTLAFSADNGTERFQVRLAAANGADGRALTRTVTGSSRSGVPTACVWPLRPSSAVSAFKFCLSTRMARGCSASNSRKATMCIPHGRPTVAASYLPPAGTTEVRFGGSTSPRKTLLWARANFMAWLRVEWPLRRDLAAPSAIREGPETLRGARASLPKPIR